MMDCDGYRSLAGYQRCIERLTGRWPRFSETRADRLRHGGETEKVAEAILEDLFTDVLDWSKGDITYQVGFADIVISRNLAKYLVIEVKRPGTLWPGRQRLLDALGQARGYAAEQRVPMIAASDGRFLYAAGIEHGTFEDRVLVDLACPEAPSSLWWLSMHGIYRPFTDTVQWPEFSDAPAHDTSADTNGALLHPKYKLAASCFAYVGDASDPATWKLPYREADGCIDGKRLPKAIQALLSNYRGAKVAGIPEKDIKAVLMVLARAASAEGKMPPRASEAAPVYCELARVLEQQGLPIE
jgi:hypothetical protein